MTGVMVTCVVVMGPPSVLLMHGLTGQRGGEQRCRFGSWPVGLAQERRLGRALAHQLRRPLRGVIASNRRPRPRRRHIHTVHLLAAEHGAAVAAVHWTSGHCDCQQLSTVLGRAFLAVVVASMVSPSNEKFGQYSIRPASPVC